MLAQVALMAQSRRLNAKEPTLAVGYFSPLLAHAIGVPDTGHMRKPAETFVRALGGPDVSAGIMQATCKGQASSRVLNNVNLLRMIFAEASSRSIPQFAQVSRIWNEATHCPSMWQQRYTPSILHEPSRSIYVSHAPNMYGTFTSTKARPYPIIKQLGYCNGDAWFLRVGASPKVPSSEHITALLNDISPRLHGYDHVVRSRDVNGQYYATQKETFDYLIDRAYRLAQNRPIQLLTDEHADLTQHGLSLFSGAAVFCILVLGYCPKHHSGVVGMALISLWALTMTLPFMVTGYCGISNTLQIWHRYGGQDLVFARLLPLWEARRLDAWARMMANAQDLSLPRRPISRRRRPRLDAADMV